MVKNIVLCLIIGVVVGVISELVRSVPDPDLWSRSGSSWIVGAAAGAIAAVLVPWRNQET